MSVSLAIMAHPKRSHFVEELLPQLPGAEVVWDRCNDRWDTGRRAVLAYDPDAQWHLVVQDDAILCPSFLPGVRAALAGVPQEHPVSFYTGKTRPYSKFVRAAVNSARQHRKHWIEMRGPLWGVAIALPVASIDQMVKEADGWDIPNYDMRMSEWFHGHGISCWYSLPSLVDHRVGEENPSLVPDRGAHQGRTAFEFLQVGDPTIINWESGACVPGDPAEWWTEEGQCLRCFEHFDDVAAVVVHCYERHGLGPVDFLASTAYHANDLAMLRESLPERMRGPLYVVGSDISMRVKHKHIRLNRRNAARKMRGGSFTIVGASRDLKYIGDRPGWSLIEGTAN